MRIILSTILLLGVTLTCTGCSNSYRYVAKIAGDVSAQVVLINEKKSPELRKEAITILEEVKLISNTASSTIGQFIAIAPQIQSHIDQNQKLSNENKRIIHIAVITSLSMVDLLIIHKPKYFSNITKAQEVINAFADSALKVLRE